MKRFSFKHLALALVASATVIGAQAQQSANRTRNCAFDVIEAAKLAADASLRKIYTQNEEQLQARIREMALDQSASNGAKTNTVYIIPVVFHVITTSSTSVENISVAQINSQMTALNQDFRKMVGTPGDGLGVDTEVEFCLATQDPNGATTTGINRIVSSLSNHNYNTQESQLKALAQWNPAKYLNVWVVKSITGGVLGYATFPGGTSTLDGVVMAHDNVGTTGTAAFPFNGGRTMTHEVGHWLSLYHTFQGGCAGMTTSNCTTGGDRVCDTPPVASPNYGCPTNTNSCSESPNLVDQIDNYMDYTNDACMSRYTAGQKARIVATLTGSRAGLQTSTGCSSTPPPPAVCATPTGLTVGSITNITAVATWVATGSVMNYSTRHRVAGTSAWTYSAWLSPSLTTNTLTGLVAATSYQVQVRARCLSGTTTAYTASVTFVTSGGSNGGGTGTCGTDAFEPNNSQSAATTTAVSPAYGKICPVGEADWYTVTTTANNPNFKAVLSQLPADYDIDLYNAAGTLITYSNNSGTSNEVIFANALGAGTFYLKVYGYAGATNGTTNYKLAWARSANTWTREEAPIGLNNQTVSGLVAYPNPASEAITLEFQSLEASSTIRLVNVNGQIVKEQRIAGNGQRMTSSVSVAELPSGIYVAQVITGTEMTTQRIVVSR